jgi:hypothetical protein
MVATSIQIFAPVVRDLTALADRITASSPGILIETVDSIQADYGSEFASTPWNSPGSIPHSKILRLSWHCLRVIDSWRGGVRTFYMELGIFGRLVGGPPVLSRDDVRGVPV